MASAEAENRTFTEKAGRAALITGLALLAFGLIGSLVDAPLPNEKLAVGGGALAVSGIIFERLGKRK